MKEIIDSIKKRKLISDTCDQILTSRFSAVPSELVRRMSRTSHKGVRYSKELKSFAMTLQYYSAKAYNLVRTTFDLALPHPSVIRRWYGKIPAEPGFTGVVFEAIRANVHASASPVICSLMIDEMAIREHVQWDGKRYVGFVDLGTHHEYDDISPTAKNALVFMAVCVNGSWKAPLGYFFVAGLTGEVANLVKICIRQLAETGVIVASLTCDGPSTHFAMLKSLGANFFSENMVCSSTKLLGISLVLLLSLSENASFA